MTIAPSPALPLPAPAVAVPAAAVQATAPGIQDAAATQAGARDGCADDLDAFLQLMLAALGETGEGEIPSAHGDAAKGAARRSTGQSGGSADTEEDAAAPREQEPDGEDSLPAVFAIAAPPPVARTLERMPGWCASPAVCEPSAGTLPGVDPAARTSPEGALAGADAAAPGVTAGSNDAQATSRRADTLAFTVTVIDPDIPPAGISQEAAPARTAAASASASAGADGVTRESATRPVSMPRVETQTSAQAAAKSTGAAVESTQPDLSIGAEQVVAAAGQGTGAGAKTPDTAVRATDASGQDAPEVRTAAGATLARTAGARRDERPVWSIAAKGRPSVARGDSGTPTTESPSSGARDARFEQVATRAGDARPASVVSGARAEIATQAAASSTTRAEVGARAETSFATRADGATHVSADSATRAENLSRVAGSSAASADDSLRAAARADGAPQAVARADDAPRKSGIRTASPTERATAPGGPVRYAVPGVVEADAASPANADAGGARTGEPAPERANSASPLVRDQSEGRRGGASREAGSDPMPPHQSGSLNPVPGGERGNPHQAAQLAPRSAAPEPAPGAKVQAVVEPPAAPEPPQTAQRVREVSIVLPREPNSGPRVELNIAERGGAVRVAVRTPDPHVRQTLRAELPALVERLEQGGYRAEATAAGVERPAAQHTQAIRAEAADASGRDPMAWDFDDGRQERQERQAHGAHEPRQPRGSGRTKSEDRSFYEFFR